VFLGLPSLAGFAFAGYHDRAHPKIVQIVLDAFLTVAAVGGDGAWRAPGSLPDPPDRRRQLRGIGRVAHLDGVVEHDPVVVIGDLGLVAELDRLAQTALGDRARIAVVQADPPSGAVGDLPGRRLFQVEVVSTRPSCQTVISAGQQTPRVVRE